MKAGSKPGVRTIGVMPTRSAAITQACTSCRSKLVCSMSIKAASNPASPMISTICGSANAADMRAERQPALAHDALHPVFLHGFPP